MDITRQFRKIELMHNSKLDRLDRTFLDLDFFFLVFNNYIGKYLILMHNSANFNFYRQKVRNMTD